MRARTITDGMIIEASKAMASVIEPSEEEIIPSPFHPDVHPRVARAVAEEAMKEGVARVHVNPEEVEERLRTWGDSTRKTSSR